MKNKNDINIWILAAIVGSIWASSEIILGSLLHNLKIPFASSILSSFAVAWLTSADYYWGRKGVIWRAGLICAFMKVLSPSANIIGPMISIAAEGFMIEFVIRTLGRNIPAYSVGGALAVSWGLFYKITMIFLTYGLDFMAIAKNAYSYIMKQLYIEQLSPTALVLTLLSIYASMGVISAIIGLRAGKSSSGFILNRVKNKESFLLKTGGDFSDNSTDTRFTPWLIPGHIAILMGLMYLATFLNPKENSAYLLATYFFAFVGISYLVITLYLYRAGTRRFKSKSMWFSLGSIVLFSAFFYEPGGKSGYLHLSSAGAKIGLETVTRSLILITGFIAISSELKNKKLIDYLKKRGLGSFALALETSFAILPHIIKNNSEINKRGFRINKLLLNMLAVSTDWVNHIERRNKISGRVFIISGDVATGKTTFTTELASRLKDEGVKIAGIIAPGRWKDEKRYGFDLLNLATNETVEFCRSDYDVYVKELGRFKFTQSGFDFGNGALDLTKINNSDAVFIDEIGILELCGEGWAKSLENILDNYEGAIILAVRSRFVESVKSTFFLQDANEITIETNSPEGLKQKLLQLIYSRTEEITTV